MNPSVRLNDGCPISVCGAGKCPEEAINHADLALVPKDRELPVQEVLSCAMCHSHNRAIILTKTCQMEPLWTGSWKFGWAKDETMSMRSDRLIVFWGLMAAVLLVGVWICGLGRRDGPDTVPDGRSRQEMVRSQTLEKRDLGGPQERFPEEDGPLFEEEMSGAVSDTSTCYGYLLDRDGHFMAVMSIMGEEAWIGCFALDESTTVDPDVAWTNAERLRVEYRLDTETAMPVASAISRDTNLTIEETWNSPDHDGAVIVLRRTIVEAGPDWFSIPLHECRDDWVSLLTVYPIEDESNGFPYQVNDAVSVRLLFTTEQWTLLGVGPVEPEPEFSVGFSFGTLISIEAGILVLREYDFISDMDTVVSYGIMDSIIFGNISAEDPLAPGDNLIIDYLKDDFQPEGNGQPARWIETLIKRSKRPDNPCEQQADVDLISPPPPDLFSDLEKEME